jgi:hypothetical protein
VLLPLLLIALAVGAAAIMAYGTDPSLAQHAHGLGMIMFSRRLEWPLVALSLILCIALLALVISNKRRAWWLIGLAPVLALFFHRFAPPADGKLYVVDFVQAAQQLVPRDDAWVVGVAFEGQSYALPYAALYRMPVVFITDYDKRLVVFWSAYGNRAQAFRVARDFKPRDLEIVSSPNDTVLIYDRRLGQFIVALTGLSPTSGKPIGIGSPIPTIKTTWAVWRKLHPDTHLMGGFENTAAPAVPIQPKMAGKNVDGIPAEKRVALVPTTQPIAIDADAITPKPANITTGPLRLLIYRDASTGFIHAMDRNVTEDLFPTFRILTTPNKKFPDAFFTDSDSNSLWTIDGKAIEGPLKGKEMKKVAIEDDLYWGVMKTWYPELQLAK